MHHKHDIDSVRTTRNLLTAFAALTLLVRIGHIFDALALTPTGEIISFLVSFPACLVALIFWGWHAVLRERAYARLIEQHAADLERARREAWDEATRQAAAATHARAEADLLRRHRERFDARRTAEEEAARKAEEDAEWASWFAEVRPRVDSDAPTIAFDPRTVVPLIFRRPDPQGETA